MSEELFNLAEFLDRVQDDKELLLELLDIFFEDYPGKRESLGQAVEAQDYETVRNIAHSLKGACGNISANSLRMLFMKLEDMGKSNDLSGAGEVLAEVDSVFKNFTQKVSEAKQELA